MSTVGEGSVSTDDHELLEYLAAREFYHRDQQGLRDLPAAMVSDQLSFLIMDDGFAALADELAAIPRERERYEEALGQAGAGVR